MVAISHNTLAIHSFLCHEYKRLHGREIPTHPAGLTNETFMMEEVDIMMPTVLGAWLRCATVSGSIANLDGIRFAIRWWLRDDTGFVELPHTRTFVEDFFMAYAQMLTRPEW